MGGVIHAPVAKKVFLGGTCNGSKWRDTLVEKLRIKWFNPVVEDWSEEAQVMEEKEKEQCDYCLYVITPKIEGYYSIAEAVNDSNKRPEKVIFLYVDEDDDITFSSHQKKSLRKIGEMIEGNGGKFFRSEEELVNYLNS